MSAAGLRTERDRDILTITLDRPDRLNALDIPTLGELRRTLQSATVDTGLRAIILTGAGAAFSAGGDVRTMDEYRARGALPQLFHELTQEQELAVREILYMPKPVVAALPGVAAGGGLSLALAADWRIASTRATLVPAFPQLGAVPDGGLTYLLPHYLGLGLAQELLFSAARLSAARARELALVHEVVEPEALLARAQAKARELADGPLFALGWIKRLLVSAFSESLDSQLVLERRGAVEAASRGELAEGIRAFLEKRPPRFLGA